MRRLLFAFLLALCAGLSARAETLRERYWRLHRERNATTRYGAPPRGSTNAVETASGDGEGELGDLVVTFDNYSSSSYGDSFGPITTTLRFTVSYMTAMGWSGYVLEGQSEPTDPGDIMSREWIICDPSTGGNLIMLFHDGTEHGKFDDLYTDSPTYMSFGSSSGTMTVSRESAGPAEITVDAAVSMAPDDIRAWLAPPPGSGEVTDGDLWLDCLAIPEGNWLCECPIAGGTNTAWRAALCPSNILAAVVWRHAVGLAPTNLPVTIAHDPTRAIGRIERLYYEQGTGVVARLRVRSAGYAEALSNRCDNLSPDLRCFTTGTNVAVRTDGWIHEHQDYIEARCVPRGEDMTSVTNVPAGVQAVVMAPIFLKGLSFVRTPLLPTYVEQIVPPPITDAYPVRPPRPWHW